MEVAPAVLIWGSLTRLLAIVYLVSFASLVPEIVALAGARGIGPVAERLDHMRRDLPRAWRWSAFPTVLWLRADDWVLRALPLVGCVAALLVVVGGPWSPLALLICWLTLLSLDLPGGLSYPWDCVLFEAGFLAVFLPALAPLPSLEAIGQPWPIVALALDVLLVRVMWGFGKYKFLGATRRDAGYLREFFISQPIPTPLGWWAHHLPTAVHRLGGAFLLLVELPLPLLIFVPGPARLLAGGGIALLMVGIQLTSNFGYFNLVVIVLCLALLDLRSPLFELSLAEATASPLALGAHLVVGLLLLYGLVCFPFNSWCARSWPFWPASENLRSATLKGLVGLYRLLQALRLVHAYGVFPPQASPPVKLIPIVEGSHDGTAWREYEWRFMPCTERSRPCWVAPRMPRWDHYLLYDGYGIASSSYLGTLVGGGWDPYLFEPSLPLERLMRRLAERESPTRALLRRDPFAAEPPPRFLRCRLHALEPASAAERRASGRWWRRRALATHVPAVDAAASAAPARGGPELFHWDAVVWRRRAPAWREFEAGARRATSLDGIERAASAQLGIEAGAIEQFWQELIPAAAGDAGDWSRLGDLVGCLERRFGRARLVEHERVASTLALGLSARLEHRIFGRPADYLPLPSYLHVGLVAGSLLLLGRRRFEEALFDEATVERAARELTIRRGLWLWGIFRYETLAFHGRTFATGQGFMDLRYQLGLPGFALLLPFLAEQFKDDQREAVVAVSRAIDDGAWRLDIHPSGRPP